jgi:eukaryotic-like serine/threonine-protein kinase
LNSKRAGILAHRISAPESRLCYLVGVMPVPPGIPATIAGKYQVERLLGQGGMGVVVLARHIGLDEEVAIKLLLPAQTLDGDGAARFVREARAAFKIKSPHVARVSDVGVLEDGTPFMVMEYLEGVDAAQMIADGRVCALADATEIVVQACDAIAQAHSSGIIHRDLKPANLFITRHPDGSPFVKVLDFGISKMTTQGLDALTRTTATMGSALYMSPEQMRQTRSADHRSDIYSLGVTLFELLTGRPPFIADTLPALCVEVTTGSPMPLLALRPDLPPELARALEKAYARDREQRYQSIAELCVALWPWVPERARPIVERIARAAGPGAPAAADPPSELMSNAAPARSPLGTGTSVQFARTTAAPVHSDSWLSARMIALALALAVVGGIAIALGAKALLAARPAASGEPAASGVTPEQPIVEIAPPPVPSASTPPEPPPSATAAAPASTTPPRPRPPKAAVARPTAKPQPMPALTTQR